MTRNDGAFVRVIRGVFVVGYVGIVGAMFLTSVGPRVLWTMLLPLVPLGIVVAGYPSWRRVCPIAAIGEIGRRLNKKKQKRVPKWMEQWFFVVSFGVLAAGLTLRLLAINGDGVFLGAFLVLLAASAVIVNLRYTGRSFCHFFCPIGVVERIYTEPRPLIAQPNSICAKCTACKKHCPDIDQENAYWHDTGSRQRRAVTFAFPGLVLAFYLYYYLRAGDWEAYFDGRWTSQPVDQNLVLGAGFFFLPAIPALVAAPLTLGALSLGSIGAFSLVERIATRTSGERGRHLALGLAAFTAFELFYLFAGAPTLRTLPYGTRIVAMVAPAIGMLFLVRRWVRDREHFVQEKGATKLLKRWPFETPPPKDPAAMLAVFEHHEHARETARSAYRDTLRELLEDGIVTRDELLLLGQFRRQMGLSDADHERLVAELRESERALFSATDSSSPEHRAQYEGYLRALTEALLDGAGEARLEELREAWGIDAENHERALADARGAAGPVQARARPLVRRLVERRRLRQSLCRNGRQDELMNFIESILRRDETALLGRILEALGATDEAARDLDAAALESEDPRALGALGALGEQIPLAHDLHQALSAPPEYDADEEALALLARDQNPWLRATAVRCLTALGGESRSLAEETAERDSHPAVSSAVVPASDSSRAAESFVAHGSLDRVLALRRVPLFAELGPEDLDAIAKLATEVRVDRGEVVVSQGQRSRELFVILDGEAEVTVKDGSGEARVVATRGAGEVLGELAMIDGGARTATITAASDVLRLLSLDGPRFVDRELARPAVSAALVKSLVARLRESADRQ